MAGNSLVRKEAYLRQRDLAARVSLLASGSQPFAPAAFCNTRRTFAAVHRRLHASLVPQHAAPRSRSPPPRHPRRLLPLVLQGLSVVATSLLVTTLFRPLEKPQRRSANRTDRRAITSFMRALRAAQPPARRRHLVARRTAMRVTLTLCLAFILTTGTRAYCQTLACGAGTLPGGDTVGCDLYGFQTWNFKSDLRTEPDIRGILKRISFNTGPEVWHDWDLCLFVEPLPGYEEYATNVFGTVNPAIEGLAPGHIELEIATLTADINDNPQSNFRKFFRDIFNIGEPVRAGGLWVQDWGHSGGDPKTELHPLHYLHQVNSTLQREAVFVGRDVSGRFWHEPNNYSIWAFELDPARDALDVSGGAASRRVVSRSSTNARCWISQRTKGQN